MGTIEETDGVDDSFDIDLDELLDLAVTIEQSYEAAPYHRTQELKAEFETKRAAFKAFHGKRTT